MQFLLDSVERLFISRRRSVSDKMMNAWIRNIVDTRPTKRLIEMKIVKTAEQS